MDILWGYVLVFVLAALPFFEVVGVVPLAILSGMHPVPTAVIGFIGNFFTVFLLIVFVDRFKAWRLKRKEDKSDEKERKAAAGQKNLGTIWSPGISARRTFYHRQSSSGIYVHELRDEKKASRSVDDSQFNDVDSAGS